MSESTAVVQGDERTGWEFRPVTAIAEFPRTGWGHRGYEEQAVDEFAAQVQRDLASAQEQINDLRLEVDRLHRYIRRQWAAVATAEAAQGGHGHAGPMAGPGTGSAAGPGAGTGTAGTGIARPGTAGAGSAGASPGSRAGTLSGVERAGTPVAQARAVLTQAQEIAERRIEEATARLTEADRAATSLLATTNRLITERLAEAEQQVVLRLETADATAAERLDRAHGLADDVLAQARRAAAQKLAQAQDDVRQLLALGRSRYEEIVVHAHRRADEAAELALHDFEQAACRAADSGRARAELDMKAAYLRTFATVSRAALQAALDVTGREFDRVLGTGVQSGGAAELEPARVHPGEVLPGPADQRLADQRLADQLSADQRPAGTAPAAAFRLAQGEARVITMPGLESAIELVRISRSG